MFAYFKKELVLKTTESEKYSKIKKLYIYVFEKKMK